MSLYVKSSAKFAGLTLQDNQFENFGDGSAPFAGEEKLFNINVSKIIAAIRRNLAWGVGIIIGTVLLGVVVTLLMVPRYLAVSQVLVEQEAEQIIEGTDLQSQSTAIQDADRFLKTQTDMLQSQSLAERVLENGKFIDNERFYVAMGGKMPEPSDVEKGDSLKSLRHDAGIRLLLENLEVFLPADSRIVQIRMKSSDADLAAKIANLYATNFIDANLKRKFESSSYARDFLASQLQDARSKVEQSERDLNQFANVAGLLRIDGKDANGAETAISITNEALIQVNAEASSAKADRVAAEERWNSVSGQPILSVPDVIKNPAIQNLVQEKAALEASLAEERVTHREDYPKVKALQGQIAELDRRINSVGNNIKQSIRLDYEAAKGKESTLDGAVEQLRTDALKEQSRGVSYNVLKRVAETNRALYDSLLDRYNQLTASAGATTSNLTIVDLAEVPREPDSPHLALNLAIALFAGIALAVAYIFAREYFDGTIRRPEELEEKLGLPLIGLIPLEDPAGIQNKLGDSRSVLSEAYHSLVTNLRFSTINGLPKSLVITSASEGEGKSTTALAIAQDVARLGKSVLLIDADLRRPTVHARINARNKAGLTDVLVGNSTIDEVLHLSEVPNLSMMTALPQPLDPSLQLGSERFAEFVREVTNRFDLVVFDCPPLLGLSDTPLVAQHVEATLFVVGAENFRRAASASALRRLKLVKAYVLGIALTKFDARTGDYAHYGYNYYSYGEPSGEEHA
ncbi:GumC family protein [Novosphingobium decolorationis]|uniref:non-specific protein-tyrosine kinase n=1 Tax=Novosphingobium decolorationis TaxID=2698673 RepID=A0ABX8E3Z1_9SPHN|nr:polysaccharide biosynthesis tyrosine autokinase [Novosphingobium decolorationis]QVM83714.1 polysaccharide biosynthesis tyrosine autokinase [Novosphingobium decolorationis]